MARKEGNYVEGSNGEKVPTAAYMSRQEFARNLHVAIMHKGWRQADLARSTGLARNNISTYVRARCFPSRVSLEKLAHALGVEAETLLPNIVKMAHEGERQPGFSLQSSGADPTKGWLTVNMLVPMDVGVAISAMLYKK